MATGDRAARAAVTAAFLCNGLVLASFVARIPSLRADLDLRDATLGLVLGGVPAGVIAGLVLAGRIVGRIGSRRLTLVSWVASAAALPLAGLAPSALVLGAALVALGATTAAMDVGMNAQGVGVERGYQRSIMVGLHGAWSLGALLGALVGALATGAEVSVAVHFVVIAALVAVAMAVSAPGLRIEDRRTDRAAAGFAWPRGALLPLALVLVAATVGETTASDWSGVHLDVGLGAPAERVGWGYVVYTAMLTVSRLTGDALVRRLGASRWVGLGGLIAGVGFLLLALVPVLPVALIGFGLVGIGLGGTIPLVFAAAARVAATPGAGVAAVSSVSWLGVLVAPPIIGTIADLTDLRVAFGLIAVLVIVLTARRPPMLDSDADHRRASRTEQDPTTSEPN